MRILKIELHNFRGIRLGRIVLPQQAALIGSNGAGKSTVVDALSLVFGRTKLVRELTEHDFFGSQPEPQDRIRLIVTLGCFPGNDPARSPQWFMDGRATEKWWNPATSSVDVEKTEGSVLCAQMGWAARFDHEELRVEQIRYFHDDDEVEDPFMEDAVAPFPYRLLREIGYFVLPARRTWAKTISFGSELFRRAVATLGRVPANAVRTHLGFLRDPEPALEKDPGLRDLISRVDQRLERLLPGKPRLKLRLTETDSESFLGALVPHYQGDDNFTLPAGRHGTGLLSLQTLALLLEIGRARRENGESFILAVEEPELHVAPGLQGRLLGDAAAVSDQIICTTHSPRAASFFEAGSIQILTKAEDPGDEPTEPTVLGVPLITGSMIAERNALIQLFTEQRCALVEALMAPRVLVPEGRIDQNWLRLLRDVSECGARPVTTSPPAAPPFGSIIGVVPTRDSAVKVTCERLVVLHSGVVGLVDGDTAGDGYVKDLLGLAAPPVAIIQWPTSWAIEDAVGWALEADPELLAEIGKRLGDEPESVSALVDRLKEASGELDGLKTHYIAHEEIAGAMMGSSTCVERVVELLSAITRASLIEHEGCDHLALDDDRSTDLTRVYRFVP